MTDNNPEEPADKNSSNNQLSENPSGNESSELETKRDEGRYDIKFASPVIRMMGNSSMIEESFDGEAASELMVEESVQSSVIRSVNTPTILSKGAGCSFFSNMSGESSMFNPSNSKARSEAGSQISPFNYGEGSDIIRNAKKLNYMERYNFNFCLAY